jgi:predicted HAD superfamily hydrolase
MLMIGDNERSDNQIPENMGIEILHLLRPVEVARSLPRFSPIITETIKHHDLDGEISLGLVIRKNFSSISYSNFEPVCLTKSKPYLIGYSIIGPLLVSFSHWLLEQARQDQIDHLYFLSREGKIIKEIFDEWVIGLENPPRSDYLELSRRATTVPAIDSINDIFKIAEFDYFPNTIEKFLYTRFGLKFTNHQWEKIKGQTGTAHNDVIAIQNRNIDQVNSILKYLETEILEKARSERKPLLQYLNKMGLHENGKKAVVDIGYGGTIQRILNQFLLDKIHGYYLMTDIRAREISNEFNVNIQGCFANEIDGSIFRPIMHIFGFELEKLLSSNDPQVEFYEVDGNKVFGHYRELSKAETQPSDMRKQIQKGALDYTKDARWIRETILPGFTPKRNTAKLIVEAFFTHQCLAESQMLEKIILDDYYCGKDLV